VFVVLTAIDMSGYLNALLLYYIGRFTTSTGILYYFIILWLQSSQSVILRI